MKSMTLPQLSTTRFPVLSLLHPREQSLLVVYTTILGITAGAVGVSQFRLPLWGAVALVLGLLLIPGYFKWRADQQRFGTTTMILSILLAAQGFHALEHLAQWAQYYLLDWSLRASNGLLSPANAEWVHFVWNWMVVLTVSLLVYRGMRNIWAWCLLIWACAHTMEHTYMFMQYLQVLNELKQLGITSLTAQGLPGILGQDGWLARSEITRGSFICTLPGITTATRLDVHFWWNVGETCLLILAGHRYLRRLTPHQAINPPPITTA